MRRPPVAPVIERIAAVADSSANAMMPGVYSSAQRGTSNCVMSTPSISAKSRRQALNSKPGAGTEGGEARGWSSCWLRFGVWNTWQGRLGVGGCCFELEACRRGEAERDRFRERPLMTGIRDAIRSAIMSLFAGGGATASAVGPERPRGLTEETRPSRGPSKASVLGGSCFVTSPDA